MTEKRGRKVVGKWRTVARVIRVADGVGNFLNNKSEQLIQDLNIFKRSRMSKTLTSKLRS